MKAKLSNSELLEIYRKLGQQLGLPQPHVVPEKSQKAGHVRVEDLSQTKPKEIFSDTVLGALKAAGYEPAPQPSSVLPFGGVRTNSYEVFKARGGRTFAITLKWQKARGSGDRKIPYEVIVLSEMIKANEVDGAYLLLGGQGWAPQLKETYISGGLRKWIDYPKTLQILELGDFLSKLEREKI